MGSDLMTSRSLSDVDLTTDLNSVLASVSF